MPKQQQQQQKIIFHSKYVRYWTRKKNLRWIIMKKNNETSPKIYIFIYCIYTSQVYIKIYIYICRECKRRAPCRIISIDMSENKTWTSTEYNNNNRDHFVHTLLPTVLSRWISCMDFVKPGVADTPTAFDLHRTKGENVYIVNEKENKKRIT